jgi:DNA gyrase/topoisomerase IV subunit B
VVVTEHSYDVADIKVLEFDAAVRKRMGMYFGVDRGDARLPARVLCAVAGHALHPATRVAAEHTLRTVVEITGDLSFS